MNKGEIISTLIVYKTLKRGKINHWMLWGCQEIIIRPKNSFFECYRVSHVRLFFLDIFEGLCGYKRRSCADNVYYYAKEIIEPW